MPDPTTPAALVLLRHQHGTIGRQQALDSGLAPGDVKYLLASGRWVRLVQGVYGLDGHRPSWIRRLWVALLHAGPGAAVSHESAARLHGFEQVRAGQVHLIVPGRRRHAPDGVVWHRSTDLDEADVVERRDLPLTNPARTVVDLAASLHVARLRLLMEQGILERQFTVEAVGTALSRVRRRGKPGVLALTRILDDLGPAADLPRTALEGMLDEVVVLSGLPAPVHEHPLPGGGGVAGFVDRCWPAAPERCARSTTPGSASSGPEPVSLVPVDRNQRHRFEDRREGCGGHFRVGLGRDTLSRPVHASRARRQSHPSSIEESLRVRHLHHRHRGPAAGRCGRNHGR